MLNYDTCGFYQHDYDEDAVKDIENVRAKFELQKEKVKHEQYIEDLMFRDFITKVTIRTSRYDFISDAFKNAQSQIGLKNKKERGDLEILTSFLLEDFFGNNKDFKLTKIIAGGYDSCYYMVDFQYNDVNLYIKIPIYKRIDASNIEFASYGKFGFGIHKSSCYSEILKTSYRISEVAEFIKEYFGLE